MLSTAILIIVVALVFDFLNGFHDAANSIATIVSTRVLTPLRAVVWAAFWNFVAAFGFGVHVARTIGTGVVAPQAVTLGVILAALVGAIVWDLLTWYVALPTSSSHALIGGLAGAALVSSGPDVLIAGGLLKICLFIVLSPLIGFVIGNLLMGLVLRSFFHSTPQKIDGIFRVGQLVSSSLYSLGHGLNDAQKTMGVIMLVLLTAGHDPEGAFNVPAWVKLSCTGAIAMGTLAGGWRIVRTMGMRLTKLKPVGGFCAETAGAIAIIGASLGGIPVSTTHTITGGIIGVGLANRNSAVRWAIAGRIVWAWVLTIPCAGVIAALAWGVSNALGLR